ncbi:MAG: phosphoribosylanthranilate isomerase [Sulfobacillus thermosulfidooxidans]|uniref:N-(5'-phosphoribosyl)anthranilate isomerase n=1 Tax=Sulfobacillus thermosulfidooxidans TaxID=28034 RepID=A0A2T2X606_SULTH|nr:MAG: phosphoribosylanthranilate isomerase [Sulfobacillus thermosulfidooxidans]
MEPDVKICGVKDALTALEAHRAGADYIGLVLAPSSRQISLDQARHLVMTLPAIRFVAVVRGMTREALQELLQKVPVFAVQYHGEANFDWVAMVHEAGRKAVATTLDERADIILMDGPEPGQGRTWDWHRPASDKPVWIAGGLTPENVGTVVRTLRPDGVDVSSGVETDGVKDIEKIRQFIKEAKQWR